MDIDSISGNDFEDLVEKLVKKLGFVTEERKRIADGGIDIRAINENPIVKGLYIIQCKRFNNPIGESIIRDLYGVVTSERANKGILITNSIFTKAAENFAQNKPLELIDGIKLAKLLEENLNEKYTKEIESIYVGEQFKLTFEHLNKHAKIINERHVEINNKRVFLGLKYYKSERGYTDFVERKIKKISTITDVFLNQFNNFNNIWGTFKKNNDNYIKVKELKNQCNEFIKTVDLIEKERGEVLSIVPPDNYYLLNVHNALINIYNPLFNFYFDFLNQLGLMIKNPEDERLIKEVENGRHIVKLDFVLSGKELQILNKEINKYINSKKKRCFIATVVYGDINAYEVIKSREWRDNILSKIFLVN